MPVPWCSMGWELPGAGGATVGCREKALVGPGGQELGLSIQ